MVTQKGGHLFLFREGENKMSIITQMVLPFSAGIAGNWYHTLTKGNTVDVNGLLKDSSSKLCPIIHWNAIWHHRIATEIATQIFDGVRVQEDLVQKYRKKYLRMFSTLPLKSNKSFSYYVGACSLDAITKNYDKTNLERLHSITEKLVGDGCFVEGTHYSIYCTDTIGRAFSLLDQFYGQDEVWILIKETIGLLTHWQRLVSNSDGVVASIGDSWYEKVEPTDEEGIFRFVDMTVHRKNDWVVVQNHRQSRFALHEHPHLDEVLIAYKDKWIVQGSGMPSYKQVMANPLKWRRPRNHFISEGVYDIPWLWRLRKKYELNRTVAVHEKTVRIIESGYKTIRWPVDDGIRYIATSSKIEWVNNGCKFICSGDIDGIEEDFAYQSVRYREDKKVRVVRIQGKNLQTSIEPCL